MLVFYKFGIKKFNICKILFISLAFFIMTFSLSSKSHERTILLYAPISLSEVIKELIDSYKILQTHIQSYTYYRSDAASHEATWNT